MKTLLYILLLTTLFVGCSDDYLDVLPKGQAIPENTDQLAEMLNATDDINNHGANFGYITDQVWLSPTYARDYELKNYIWSDFPYDEITNDDNWNKSYQAIAIASYVINNINEADKGEMYDPVYTKARALFIRANAYFILVNSYAKHYNASTAFADLGVPLILEYDVTQKKPRATVEEVYEQIFSDLDACLDDLVDDVQFRTDQSKAAAYALYTRIYLFQEEYELAADYARMALDAYDYLYDMNNVSEINPGNPGYGLIGFDGNPKSSYESIYGISTQGGAVPWFSTDAYNEYSDSDFRKTFWAQDPVGFYYPDEGHLFIVNKGYAPDASFTVPEAILNYCEALLKKDTPDKVTALTYLNMLRDNRYVTGTIHDDSDLLASVMKERKLEFVCSALRWWDMKRLGVTVTHEWEGQTYTLTPESPNYVFAIPPNVMKHNDLLIQNPRGL